MFRTLSLLFLTLATFQASANVTSSDIFNTINERLSYMEDVALYKANKSIKIEDLKRELIVLDKANQSAQKEGLDKQSVMGFFQAQISAAKAIQYRYRAELLSVPNDKTPRDLKSVVRPNLIRLGAKLNEELAEFLTHGGRFKPSEIKDFNQTLTSPFLSENDKKMLFNALTKIQVQKESTIQ
jgi:chorismate mutase